jgi:hypothetical protein
MPLRPPFRVMVVGCGTPTLFDASDADRGEIFLSRFKQLGRPTG